MGLCSHTNPFDGPHKIFTGLMIVTVSNRQIRRAKKDAINPFSGCNRICIVHPFDILDLGNNNGLRF